MTVSDRDPLHPQVRMFTAVNITCLRLQLHWSQKPHNTTVRTDSR